MLLSLMLPVIMAHTPLWAQSRSEVRAQGNYRVSANLEGKRLDLQLKSGFGATLRATGAWQGGSVTLQIAKVRAVSAEVHAGFVPIGPTVELTAAPAEADVRFLAERFRVRSGHRLVLAYELPCALPDSCPHWALLAARYEDMRCVATGVRPNGRRLQFGSVPAP